MSKAQSAASSVSTPLAYRIDEFCKAYGLGRSLVYEELRAGKLQARKVGGRTLIFKADADRWANSLPVLGAAR